MATAICSEWQELRERMELQMDLKTILKRQTVIDWRMHEHAPYSPKLLMFQDFTCSERHRKKVNKQYAR